MRKGTFIVLVGPPGVGKTTVAEKLLERNPDWARLVTTTSRKPRRKSDGTTEVDGKDYFFVTDDEFRSKIADGEFLEWMDNYGRLYGSSVLRLEAQLERHPVVLGIIDVKGARRIKTIRPESVAIFIEPSDPDDCRKRLLERDVADRDNLSRRIANIGSELSYREAFDWIVVNRDGDIGFVLRSIESLVRGLS